MNMKSSLLVLLLTAIVAHTANTPSEYEWAKIFDQWKTPGNDAAFVVEAYRTLEVGEEAGVKVSINQAVFAESETKALQDEEEEDRTPGFWFSVDSIQIEPINGFRPNYSNKLISMVNQRNRDINFAFDYDKDVQSLDISNVEKEIKSKVTAVMKVEYITDYALARFNLLVYSRARMWFQLKFEIQFNMQEIDNSHSAATIELYNVQESGQERTSLYSSDTRNTFSPTVSAQSSDRRPVSNPILERKADRAREKTAKRKKRKTKKENRERAVAERETRTEQWTEVSGNESIPGIQIHPPNTGEPTTMPLSHQDPTKIEREDQWASFFKSVTDPKFPKSAFFTFSAYVQTGKEFGHRLNIRNAHYVTDPKRAGTSIQYIFNVPSYEFTMIGDANDDTNISAFNQFLGGRILLESHGNAETAAELTVEYNPITTNDGTGSKAIFVFGPANRNKDGLQPWTVTITMTFTNGEIASIEMEKVKFHPEVVYELSNAGNTLAVATK